MKQEKHEIRCSEIEKRQGKYCFFEKSYKNTRTMAGHPYGGGLFLFCVGKADTPLGNALMVYLLFIWRKIM